MATECQLEKDSIEVRTKMFVGEILLGKTITICNKSSRIKVNLANTKAQRSKVVHHNEIKRQFKYFTFHS